MTGSRPRDARTRLVADGYDRMADRYGLWAAGIEGDPRDRMIARLLAALPPRARVLDLGCGSGVPSTKVLADRFEVVGVDFSTAQIEKARVNVPTARFIVGDLTEVEFPDGSFDAVTAFYSLNHVPREDHAPLLADVARWLVPGGLFLAAFGLSDEANWTGDWLGVPMYFSSHDPDTTRGIFARTGFELIVDEVLETHEPEGPMSFLWVLAGTRRPVGSTAESAG